MLIITVHDRVAGTWSAPTVTSNRNTAIRDFRQACSTDGTSIAAHPDDYELYIIGEWIVPYDINALPTFKAFTSFEFVEAGVKHETT